MTQIPVDLSIYVWAEKKISNFKILGDKYIEGKTERAFIFQRV